MRTRSQCGEVPLGTTPPRTEFGLMRVTLPIDVIGTLNITAYRGQWAFAPEL
jgi:hypothetical protein